MPEISEIEASAASATLTFSGFGGLKLAADAYGSAEDPAVVLLHGPGQSRRAWRGVGRALSAAGRYVVALDMRGHGDSEWAADGRYDLQAFAEDVRAVLKALPTRPVVVGASVGGLAALAALEGHAETLASGLVLVDASPWMESEAGRAEAMTRAAQGYASLEEALEGARELSGRPFEDADALRSHMREAEGRFYWRWDPRFMSGGQLAEAVRLEPVAAGLTLPVLIIHGMESAVVTRDSIDRFRALMPDAEVVDIEGAGHLVAADRLDEFNAVLLEFLERRLPRSPISYEQGSDPRVLRDVLGCFGTGVVIATALDPDGKPVGLTANSFTSVSLDPPLVLFCLARTATSLPAFDVAEAYAVNVLHIGQQPTSARFAKRGEERFEVTPWETWETGAPIITGSLASIECAPYARHEAGDHIIFIGEVRRARFEPRRDPLFYFRGKYRRLHFV